MKLRELGQQPEAQVKARNAALAQTLGMDPFAEKTTLVEQNEAIEAKLQELNQQPDALAKQRNAQLAQQLGIVDFDDDAALDQQNAAIRAKMHAAIQAELDQQNKIQVKARYQDIAAQLNIQGFDGDADLDNQRAVLLQRIQELNAVAGPGNDADVKAQQAALAAVLGIELDDAGTLDDRNTKLEEAMQGTVDKLVEELEDIRTPGHPKAKPEVKETLGKLERALEMADPDEEDDEYLRRWAISEEMKKYITQARERSEEEAIDVLEVLEDKLELEVDENDDRAKRLARVHEKLGTDDVTEEILNDIEIALQDDDEEEAPQGNRDDKLQRLRDRLTNEVEEVDERAGERQTALLEAAEKNLDINADKNADERGKAFSDELAKQLDVEYDDDNPGLNDRKEALKAKVQVLNDEVDEAYANEGTRRNRNNEIAQLLGIEDFDEAAPIDNQNEVLQRKLHQLDSQIDSAGQLTVKDRIADIDAVLDKQVARLSPKPRYVLDREVAWSKRALAETESELEAVRGKHLEITGREGVHPITDEEATVLNQKMKQIQTDLGLDAPDEQNTDDRVDAIRQHLQGDGAGKRGEAAEKLRAVTTDLKVPVEGDPGVLEEGDYFDAITAYTATHGQDEVEEVVGKLPETRKKYDQVTTFLQDHEQKRLAVANAEQEQRNAQQDLDRKKQEIADLVGDDQAAKTRLRNEKDQLDLLLKQKTAAVPVAQKDLDDHEALLKTTEESMGLKPAPTDEHDARVNALRDKQAQLGGDDGNGGKIEQLTQQQLQLAAELEAMQQELETKNAVVMAAEEAVENEGGPYQYTPKQAKVELAIQAYSNDNIFKDKALRAAIGLANAAKKANKPDINLVAFDFDDEFASIRLQALVGDELTLEQSSRIVEVFRKLKETFPTAQAIDDGEPVTAFQRALDLADQARAQIQTGPQHFDDVINGLGSSAINYEEHDPRYLKAFSDYFAEQSENGNMVIVLLRDGLVNHAELGSYMRAARTLGQAQQIQKPTVDQTAQLLALEEAFAEQYQELEHFLSYKHGVEVAPFKKIITMLSDDGIDNFIDSAFKSVAVTATGPTGMKESVTGMTEYAASIIANIILDDIALNNGIQTGAFLANIQETLTPYAYALGVAESDLIKVITSTLSQLHASAVEHQVFDFWVKPSAYLVQAVTWYFNSYKPLLATSTAWQASKLALSNMGYLYLLDLTNRGDYLHRIPTPFQNWLERYEIDQDRTGQYAFHSDLERITEVGGLLMPFGKAASMGIMLNTGKMLFARQYHANPHMYRSFLRLVPQMVKSMGSRQGIQVPLLHRVTPQKVKMLASVTAGVVLGPVTTAGSYVYGLMSGFTTPQVVLASMAAGVSYDFFMNDNKMLTQWLSGPVGRGIDSINRWRGTGESEAEYIRRTAVANPQRHNETDQAYAQRVKKSNMMHGWTRNESNYLHFRERRDQTMKLYDQGWEKYFKENVPKWSFSHAESIPYSYTLGAFYEWQKVDDKDEKIDIIGKPPIKSTKASSVTSTPVVTQAISETVPVKTPAVPLVDLDEDEDWETVTTTTEAPVTTSTTVDTSVSSEPVSEPSSSSVVQTTTASMEPVETPATPPVDLDKEEDWEVTTTAAPVTTTTTAVPITPATTTSTTTTSTTTSTAPKETPVLKQPTSEINLDDFNLDDDWDNEDWDTGHDEF
ncbi:hypothetical protein [Endozoicomonas numazuensis]|uniref:hypothetical protein n=1 Tax=Endozoicomonas numazuensis TaxID=1137799 RepID=UPI000AB107B2|nr:hypothetical protein [Endozoicomonas numazuensis]